MKLLGSGHGGDIPYSPKSASDWMRIREPAACAGATEPQPKGRRYSGCAERREITKICHKLNNRPETWESLTGCRAWADFCTYVRTVTRRPGEAGRWQSAVSCPPSPWRGQQRPARRRGRRLARGHGDAPLAPALPLPASESVSSFQVLSGKHAACQELKCLITSSMPQSWLVFH